MDNEFLLQDRLQKIKQIVDQYGEDNFYIAFSGGKDSTVLSVLIDMALPDNKIPRVFADTGIELNMIRKFVFDMANSDDRIIVIRPSRSIKKMLEEEGYPFKSKTHSRALREKGKTEWSQKYFEGKHSYKSFNCPKKLKYQKDVDLPFKVSEKCCDKLKKKPMKEYSNASGRKYAIVGIMASEGGQRANGRCMTFVNGSLKEFHPLITITKEWEDWFIEKYDIKICDIYKPPYNFRRTGCKGCPFALKLQNELEQLDTFFPEERKQCEVILKPVYDEYRRIGYRLRS